MKRFIEQVFHHYKAIHITFILLALYFLNMSFFSSLLITYTPLTNTCPFNELTGEDCPYCHITAQVETLKDGGNQEIPRETKTQPLGVILYYFAWSQVIVRLIMLVVKPLRNKKIFYIDVALHSGLLVAFFIYNIMFIAHYIAGLS